MPNAQQCAQEPETSSLLRAGLPHGTATELPAQRGRRYAFRSLGNPEAPGASVPREHQALSRRPHLTEPQQ